MIIEKIINKIIVYLNKISNYKKLRKFNGQLQKFKRTDINKRFSLNKKDQWPCFFDDTAEAYFEPHYLYHPAWAARIIKKINPEKHIDISSILHFSTLLSAFIPTEFYDYRPAKLNLTGLKSGSINLTELKFEDNSIESISCMHTIEHIGLGRYGDPIDPEGDIKAINELKRVVKKNGSLIFVTPVGMPRIQYNAHRIYSFEMINDLFKEFELKDFSLVTDSGEFISQANPALVVNQKYGCGCFWLIKK